MSFYVTLPCDSSLDYFPHNKISHFITRLPAPLELKGEWEVGVTEFIYPHIWNNVLERKNEFEYNTGTGIVKKAKIPYGYYETPSDIIKWMHYQDFKNTISIIYNKPNRKVKLSITSGAKITLSQGLAESLGFAPGDYANEEEPTRENILKVFEGTNVADPNYDLKLLYIYSDIIEPQIVGHTVAPLLRVITVKGKDGDMIHETFDRPHYLPISRKNFQTIETVIRTHTGNLVPFERGQLIVKLHFRQKFLS